MSGEPPAKESASPPASDAVAADLIARGFCQMPSGIDGALLAQLRGEIFNQDAPGARCLLDLPPVAQAAVELKSILVGAGALANDAVAIQAIAFDKTSLINWNVSWHQDLMFPFEKRVNAVGYDMACLKGSVDFARPPRTILERLLAARLHLDICDETNGPLRLVPGSHREGMIAQASIAARAAQLGEVTALAAEGDILAMRPLLLHASSKARKPRHRRVLHIVYYAGPAIPEVWHRAVG